MSALAQLNGQTTGVVYKVNYKPEGKYYTELAAEMEQTATARCLKSTGAW